MPINLQSSPAYDAQAISDATDWQAQSAIADLTGILSGCVVSALGSPGMQVQTTAGSVAYGGTIIATPAATPIVQPASQSDRRDIVVADAGTVSVVMGTPCGTANWNRNSFPGLPPVKPAIPNGCVLLGEIYVATGVTSITNPAILPNTTILQFSTASGGGGGGSYLPLIGGTLTGPVETVYGGTASVTVQSVQLSADNFPRISTQGQSLIDIGSPYAPTNWGTHVSGDVGGGTDYQFEIEQLTDTARILQLNFPRVRLTDGTNYMHLSQGAWSGATLNSTQTVVVDVGTMSALASAGTLTVNSIGYGNGTITYTGTTGTGSTGTLTGCTSTGISSTFTDNSQRKAFLVDDSFGSKIIAVYNYGGLAVNDLISFVYNGIDNTNAMYDIVIGFLDDVNRNTGSAILFGADDTYQIRRNATGLVIYASSAASISPTPVSTFDPGGITTVDGNATGPALAFSDGTTGFHRSTSAGFPAIGFDIGATEFLRLQSSAGGTGTLFPITTNVINLGGSANRFAQTYGGTYFANFGTNSAPSYSFVADPASGIHLVTAGQMVISAASVAVATITNTGVALTGAPTAPTAAASVSNTQLATTAFVAAATAAASVGGNMNTTVYDPANVHQQLLGTTATQTMTNKRITARVSSLSANAASVSVNTDSFDGVEITGQTVGITFSTTGTPQLQDWLEIGITGTTSVAFTFSSNFESSGTITLPGGTSGTTRLDMAFKWNPTTSKWRIQGFS